MSGNTSKKGNWIHFRLSDAQHDLLIKNKEKYEEAYGETSLSDYARKALLTSAAGLELELIDRDIRSVDSEMKHILLYLEKIRDPDRGFIRQQITDVIKELDRIRGELENIYGDYEAFQSEGS